MTPANSDDTLLLGESHFFLFGGHWPSEGEGFAPASPVYGCAKCQRGRVKINQVCAVCDDRVLVRDNIFRSSFN